MSTTVDASGLQFFFLDEADAIDALSARIVPGSPDDPGAREAGVLTYIDRALAGPYTRWQLAYREGLRALNAYTERQYGKAFAALSEAEQDAVVAALERDEVPGFGPSGSANFFLMVWAHTVEGMFSDPTYGGNRDAVGWKLIGFPGAQYGYTSEDMRYGADLSRKPIMTLADVRRLAREQPQRFYRRPGPRPASAEPSRAAVPEAKSVADDLTTPGA